MTEGVDYSRTPNANWPILAKTLKASGKHFAGRYLVIDKSPTGRGITAEEYQALWAADIDVFYYWQTTTSWMLGGWAAGVNGAKDAERNRIIAGMPPAPIYFACDFDANFNQQAAIDDCLRGAASVIGPERVGLYAGYYPLQRAKENGSAQWFCQTVAWSGGRLMEGVHLYQYDTQGNFIGGVDVDLVRSYQANFGQASLFDGASIPDPVPVPPVAKPKPTIDWDSSDEKENTGLHDYEGTPVLRMRVRVTAPKGTQPRWGASIRSKPYGKPVPHNGEFDCVATFNSGWGIAEMPDGSYPRFSLARVDLDLPLPKEVGKWPKSRSTR